MAQFAEAIPHLLLRVFAPALGITLVAWLTVLFVRLFSGKRQSCRFLPAENGSGESAASPRGGLGKPVWAGLAALAVVCTALCGKNTNGVQGVGGPLLHSTRRLLPLRRRTSPTAGAWRRKQKPSRLRSHPPMRSRTNSGADAARSMTLFAFPLTDGRIHTQRA